MSHVRRKLFAAQAGSKTNKLVVRVPGISDMARESVNSIMGYIYSGKLEAVLCNDTRILVQLMSLARHFGLVQLERSLLFHIGSTLSTRNVVDMFESTDLLNMAELRTMCMRFIDEHSSELLTGELCSPLSKLSASSLLTLLQRDTFCQSEASVLRVVREWHAYNNMTQMDASVFACVRLAATDEHDLIDLLIAVTKETPAVQETVRLAAEKRRKGGKPLAPNDTEPVLVFEMSDGLVRSPYRACAKLSQHDQCLIVQLANAASVNYVSVRDKTVEDEQR